MAQSTPAARPEAFADLGCNLDPGVVCQLHGGDPLRAAEAAEAAGHPQRTAEIASALMRRQIAAAAPVGPGDAMQSASAGAEAIAPRRTRL